MAKTKYTFPVPICPGCQYHQVVGGVVSGTRYCNGFPKRRKPKRFRKSDPKYKPPKWCPRLISPPACRIYGFVNKEAEMMAWMFNGEVVAVQKGDKRQAYPSVLASHYRLRLELALGLTAKQFYDAMWEADAGVADEISKQVDYGEVIEIDDGLKPYYFYYSSFRVIPLAYFDRSRVQPAEGGGKG